MPTLLEDLRALWQLQQIDSRIDRLKATQAALDTGAQIAADYNQQKSECAVLRSVANKAQAAQHDAEMQLSSIEGKAAQVNKTLYGGTVTSSRELENLQKELEMLGRQKGSHEEDVLKAMEVASEAVAAADAADGRLAALGEDYRRVRTAFQLRSAELSAQIESLMPDRDAALQAVSRVDLLNRYDSVRTRKGGIGAALLDKDGQCGACHTKVNSQLAEQVREGASVCPCEHCGRLLIPEG